MKRGFTLIELMVASSISLVVLTALVSMFIAIAKISKSASDEFQAALQARAMREKLFYQLLPPDSHAPNGYGGLLTARNIETSTSGLNADLRFTTSEGNPAFLIGQRVPGDTPGVTLETAATKKIKHQGAATNETGLLYVYLTVEKGDSEKFKFKDRVVIPLPGAVLAAPETTVSSPLDYDNSYYHYSF